MRVSSSLRLLIAALAASMALLVASAGSATAERNVAPCDKAIAGHGSADWRTTSVDAGPVGVRSHPLSEMTRADNGLVTKMPVLVEGRAPDAVIVSVPPALQGRVFLLYGNALDRNGHPSTSFHNTRGYGGTEFQLCGDKPRTIWPGAIKVRGMKPVRLLVFAEGRPEAATLRLGRPKVLAVRR
jgi:hypothetical protein